tara:strand:+ start:2150 stop:2950 length:801 start_codon:yes stop_codon:yes gene_type:complete
MRIISKYHDYYDSASAYGQDLTLVYARNTEQFNLQTVYRSSDQVDSPLERNDASIEGLKNKIEDTTGNRWNTTLHVGMSFTEISESNSFLLLFCGKVYVGFEFVPYDTRRLRKSELPKYKKKSKDFCYNIGHLDKLIHDTNHKSLISNWTDPTHSKYTWNAKDYRHMYERRFNIDFGNNQYAMDLHQQLNCPTILLSDDFRVMTLNPCLKNIGFQRVLDSFTTFQELSMFVGGVLPRNTNEMVEISNEDKIHKAGFNKQSFRHPIK